MSKRLAMLRASTVLIGSLLLAPLTGSADDKSVIIKLPKDPWALPDLELVGKLGEAMEFSDCERISGLTCTVTLKKGGSLPSQIFVQEVYPDGKHAGKSWPLIYPHLLPGEKGKATFLHIHGAPERLILRGVWSGAG